MLKQLKSRSVVPALVLILLPGLALAEVSVRLHPQTGKVMKIFFLTRGEGSDVIWSQVRAGVPRQQMLNPLGDVSGDGAPTIRSHPVSGAPWVVWPARVANVAQIAVSSWDGSRWTPRQYVVPTPEPYYLDDLNPDLTFDATGQPFLVWQRSDSINSVQFSTLSNGIWTPPLRLSEEGVDSRFPSITLSAQTALVRFLTPGGWVTRSYETTVMIESAQNLMDTPIPPGNSDDPSGGGGSDEGDIRLFPK